ncbi:MAG: hypothetical protein AB9888_13205 [Bacteroidales bacterium]|jgi:hypothetical protein
MEIVMALTITPRNIHAGEVQNILTKHGCIITQRIGIHEVTPQNCSTKGLIILHIVGSEAEIKALQDDLHAVEGVKANFMAI